MSVPTVAGLLAVWDAASPCPPAERSLALLGATYPQQPTEALNNLSAGRRAAYLLDLRAALFGPQVVALADCPRCGDRSEITFRIADIRLPTHDPPKTLELAIGGYELCFRLPTGADLAELLNASPAGDPVAWLLCRCLRSARRQSAECDPQTLPDEIVDAITDRMTQADPQADTELSLRCQACGHTWLATFDIASFLWSEIDAWAERLLHDVHVLARAYGWRETDILALSPRRRQRYLEMAGS